MTIRFENLGTDETGCRTPGILVYGEQQRCIGRSLGSLERRNFQEVFWNRLKTGDKMMRKNIISGALAFMLALSMNILSSAQAQSKGQGEAQKGKPVSSKSGTFTFIPHADLE